MYLGFHVALPAGIGIIYDRVRLYSGKKALFRESDYLILGFLGISTDMFWPHFGGGSHDTSLLHSIWVIIPVYLVIFFTLKLILPGKSVFNRSIIFFLAYISHHIVDLVSGGLTLLYPISDKRIGFLLIPKSLWIPIDIISIVAVILLYVILVKRNINLNR